MSQFAFFAALLCLLAIAFAVSAIWQKSRGLALALALGLPLAAAALYHLKGEPAALDPSIATAPASIEDAVEQLQQRLAAEPGNLEGIVLLARSYMAMEKFDLARDYYSKAVKLAPEDSDLSVEYAESMLRASADRSFPPEAVVMLEEAVAKNPENQRALFFLGTSRMQAGNPAEAVAIWETLLPMLDPATAAELRKQIDSARLAAGMAPLPAAETLAPVSAPDGLMSVTIQIDPTLAKQVAPGDVLYVFARSPNGGGPPFAAKRIELGTLPLTLQLSDADSPMPAAKLSSQEKVMLMARLSKSGDAKASSGDIEADPIQATVGGEDQISLTLNRQVP